MVSTEEQSPIIGHGELHRTDPLPFQELRSHDLESKDRHTQQFGTRIGAHATCVVLKRNRASTWQLMFKMNNIYSLKTIDGRLIIAPENMFGCVLQHVFTPLNHVRKLSRPLALTPTEAS